MKHPALVLPLAAMALQGCGLFGQLAGKSGDPIVIPAYELQPGTWHPGHVAAGFARIDITPPPGIPTGGHGPAGAMSRGYWTRLYARSFLFADSTGHLAMLVSCDLFAIPRGLTESVAQRVALAAGQRHLFVPPEAIVIAATHTHQSPGNFMTAAVYNQYGSKYSGFDPSLFEFLVDRITTAIVNAMDDAMRSGPAVISVHGGSLPDSLVLNRSPYTFVSNWDAAQLMDRLNKPAPVCRPGAETGESKDTDWDLPGCPRLRAIDRQLTVIEVTGAGRRRAALVFAAFHPTALAHNAPVFNADVVGVAVSALEREWAGTSAESPVVGFFNGAEGDVVARRGARDIRDVVRLADIFQRAIRAAVMNSGKTVSVSSVVARRGVMSPGTSYTTAPQSAAALAIDPRFGVAALGGGEGDRTKLYQLGWSEGSHEVPGDGQGGKLYALDSQLLPIQLTNLLAPRGHFPASLPVSYVAIGPLRLVAVPLEMSTAAGHRLREALGGADRVEIIGLANEYSSYVATPDEYEAQDYMAASTIWGPRELAAVIATVRCLAGQVNDRNCAPLFRANPFHVDAQQFDPGGPPQKVRGFRLFGPDAVGETLESVDDQLDEILRDDAGAPERNLPWFSWTERASADSDDYAAAAHRSIRILQQQGKDWLPRVTNSGSLDDDQGVGFTALLRAAPRHGSAAGRREWAAIWVSPILEEIPRNDEFRFEVTVSSPTTTPKTILSCPFTVDLTPAQRHSPVPVDQGSCLP